MASLAALRVLVLGAMGKARMKIGMAVVARISVTGCIAAHECEF